MRKNHLTTHRASARVLLCLMILKHLIKKIITIGKLILAYVLEGEGAAAAFIIGLAFKLEGEGACTAVVAMTAVPAACLYGFPYIFEVFGYCIYVLIYILKIEFGRQPVLHGAEAEHYLLLRCRCIHRTSRF